jgi:hypothetical protein
MKVNKSNIPSSCPSCGGALIVVRLECSQCGTEVTGEFNLCPVCRLDGEIKKLFDLFIDARGNLKQVQRELGLSYPTVRLKIEAMFRKLIQDEPSRDPKEILAKVRSGEISVDEAEKLLRRD